MNQDQEADDKFFDRVDAYIQLANSQFDEAEEVGDVSAAFMYAFSNYTAWVSSQEFSSAEAMRAKKGEILAFFTKQFQNMLKQSLDDYIENFDDNRADEG
jgi:hypothetical protein